MKIENLVPTERHFNTVGAGEAFRFGGYIWMKLETRERERVNAVCLNNGLLDEFSGAATVTHIRAKVVIE
jgi:hypothetical protein